MILVWIALVAACGYFAWTWFAKIAVVQTAKIAEDIAAINEKHGTSFPNKVVGSDLVMFANFPGSTGLLIDPNARKICVFQSRRTGLYGRVFDYDHFKSYSYHGELVTGTTSTYRYYIDFLVNDLSTPKLRIRAPNQETCSTWHQRLILLKV